MSHGLQVFDSNGVLEFDSNARMSRYIGSIVFNTTTPGTFTVPYPGASLDGTWYVTGAAIDSIAKIITNGVQLEVGYYTPWTYSSLTLMIFRI